MLGYELTRINAPSRDEKPGNAVIEATSGSVTHAIRTSAIVFIKAEPSSYEINSYGGTKMGRER